MSEVPFWWCCVVVVGGGGGGGGVGGGRVRVLCSRGFLGGR